MRFLILFLLSVSAQAQTPQDFVTGIGAKFAAGTKDTVAPLFASGQAPYWVQEKGAKAWKAEIMAAAPGIGDAAQWVVFSRRHGPEEDGDHVCELVRKGDAWLVGREIPEDIAVPFSVEEHHFDMTIEPSTQIVNITARFVPKGAGKSLLMRLGADYHIISASFGATEVPVVGGADMVPALGPANLLLRSASVFWMQGDFAGKTVTLKYSAKIAGRGGDRAGPDAAFLTAYWWPHVGRRPLKHDITLHVPPDWIAIGQGEMQRESRTEREYAVTWKSDLAVCFLTVAAGPFVIGAETKDEKGRVYRSYMMPDKVEKSRAETIVNDCKRAVNYFEERFGAYPFSHYYVIDSPGYYGLECYSFTILEAYITGWAPTHEIGHTWFGGIVPNPYLHSIWNESFTQYVDSVLFKAGKDSTLSSGRGNRNGDALSAIRDTSHRSTNEGYMRGAFTLHMLEQEMGLETMIRCLRVYCTERRGMVSDWNDFHKIVNKVTGKNYDWFFSQWVYSGVTPVLKIEAVDEAAGTVTVSQTKPYRISFVIEWEGDGGSGKKTVTIDKTKQTFTLGTRSLKHVKLNVRGTLARGEDWPKE